MFSRCSRKEILAVCLNTASYYECVPTLIFIGILNTVAFLMLIVQCKNKAHRRMQPLWTAALFTHKTGKLFKREHETHSSSFHSASLDVFSLRLNDLSLSLVLLPKIVCGAFPEPFPFVFRGGVNWAKSKSSWWGRDEYLSCCWRGHSWEKWVEMTRG